jgi:hypothetical protein
VSLRWRLMLLPGKPRAPLTPALSLRWLSMLLPAASLRWLLLLMPLLVAPLRPRLARLPRQLAPLPALARLFRSARLPLLLAPLVALARFRRLAPMPFKGAVAAGRLR